MRWGFCERIFYHVEFGRGRWSESVLKKHVQDSRTTTISLRESILQMKGNTERPGKRGTARTGRGNPVEGPELLEPGKSVAQIQRGNWLPCCKVRACVKLLEQQEGSALYPNRERDPRLQRKAG